MFDDNSMTTAGGAAAAAAGGEVVEEEERERCDVFIGVASRPGNVRERAAMRATWLGALVEAAAAGESGA